MATIKLISITFLLSCIIAGGDSKIYPESLETPADDHDSSYLTSTKNLRSNEIPEIVFTMTELRHLSIQGMDCDYGDTTKCWMIKEIPKQISNLKSLKSLSLAVNSISALPPELKALQNLTLLDLSDNLALTNVDILTGLPNLEQLYLNGCNITSLPENLGAFRKLRHLGLVGNNIAPAERARIKQGLPNCNIRF